MGLGRSNHCTSCSRTHAGCDFLPPFDLAPRIWGSRLNEKRRFYGWPLVGVGFLVYGLGIGPAHARHFDFIG